jgi:hypothetical protein
MVRCPEHEMSSALFVAPAPQPGSCLSLDDTCCAHSIPIASAELRIVSGLTSCKVLFLWGAVITSTVTYWAYVTTQPTSPHYQWSRVLGRTTHKQLGQGLAEWLKQ